MADPVMNADNDVMEMRSTIQPRRKTPRASTMHPAMTANAVATTLAGQTVPDAFTSATTVPTTVDKTATGPIDISLDVPKIQYVMGPMKEEYSPN